MPSGELIVDARAAAGLGLGVLRRSFVFVFVSHVRSPRSRQAAKPQPMLSRGEYPATSGSLRADNLAPIADSVRGEPLAVP
jgi:hypothetical protein